MRFLMVTVAGMAVLFAAAKWWASHYPITAPVAGYGISKRRGHKVVRVWSDGTGTIAESKEPHFQGANQEGSLPSLSWKTPQWDLELPSQRENSVTPGL